MSLSDTIKSGLTSTYEWVLYGEGPVDYMVRKGGEVIDYAQNNNITLSNGVNVSEWVSLAPSLPGFEYVERPMEFMEMLIDIPVSIFIWLKAFFSIIVFFLLDPMFTILLYEFMVMAIIMGKSNRGELHGPEMVGELVKAQFFLFDWLFKLSVTIITLLIRCGSFLRDLVPFI